MLKHELRQDDEILVLSPKEPLEAADFAALESDLNTYTGTARGVSASY